MIKEIALEESASSDRRNETGDGIPVSYGNRCGEIAPCALSGSIDCDHFEANDGKDFVPRLRLGDSERSVLLCSRSQSAAGVVFVLSPSCR